MANRYWVGGSGTWDNSSTTHWSATSGGASGASVPGSGDDVFFDGSSGSGTTINANTNNLCRDLDFTGWAGTFDMQTFQMNCYRSLIFSSGMTITNGGQIVMQASSGSPTITTNGLSVNTTLIFGSLGVSTATWTLQDHLIMPSGSSLTLDSGTLNANNKNVTTNNFVYSSGATATLTMGFGTWTLLGTGTVWNVTTGLTLNANTSTIKATNTSNSAITFQGRGYIYNNLWFDRGASTGKISVLSSNTFNDFKDTGIAAHTRGFQSGSTQTLTTWNVSGSPGNLITINTDSGTGVHNLVKSGGGTISADYLNIQHSVATPGTTWYAGANSVDNQAVATAGSGWIFTALPSSTKQLAALGVG